jgi:hypothetical protein
MSMRTHIASAVCERKRHSLVEAVRRDAADIERALLARGAGEERALEDEAVLHSFLVSARLGQWVGLAYLAVLAAAVVVLEVDDEPGQVNVARVTARDVDRALKTTR